MNVVGIIPARGGSKGLPGKNLLPLAGRPLIAHTIVAAKAAGLAAVHVSSDSAEILAVAAEYGAAGIRRPAELATDGASSESALRHALEAIGPDRHSHVMLLQPTSPLRTAAHIGAAVAAFEKTDAKSLISVCAPAHHPYKSFVVEGGFLKPLMGAQYLSAARQSLPEALNQNGAIYLLGVQDFLANNTFFIPPVLPYVMDRRASVDIDDEADFRYAECLM